MDHHPRPVAGNEHAVYDLRRDPHLLDHWRGPGRARIEPGLGRELRVRIPRPAGRRARSWPARLRVGTGASRTRPGRSRAGPSRQSRHRMPITPAPPLVSRPRRPGVAVALGQRPAQDPLERRPRGHRRPRRACRLPAGQVRGIAGHRPVGDGVHGEPDDPAAGPGHEQRFAVGPFATRRCGAPPSRRAQVKQARTAPIASGACSRSHRTAQLSRTALPCGPSKSSSRCEMNTAAALSFR